MSGGFDHDERLARLRLIRTPRVGPVAHAQLIARFGNALAAIEALPDLVRRNGGAMPPIADAASALREMEQVERIGARQLFRGEPLYPAWLDRCDGAPAMLVLRGDPALLQRRAVAMVGARNASGAAMRFARMLAHELSSRGWLVVSGLARGIDTAAHVGSLEQGTAAVIAGGIDIVYPPENDRLQAEIAERGLLIAEQPPGVEPRARHFPHRNRIIAGLAEGTVVVEAAPKSGSLITARLAGEFGREVMAVPGSPLDPRAQGCNLLIREGATLVQSADDIIESLSPIGGVSVPPLPLFASSPPREIADGDRDAVLGLLGPVPLPVDELIRLCGAPAPAVQVVLLDLELAGRLERHAGGKVSLTA
ncbi:DNA-processing protein DprA [Rhizorhabdus sp. FW153]|uniref:DNA-processing protein DprA n=1 Tax=Rhizorhabdus sp. FW153 TaxID=3400216 RepID=UPI003CE85B41